MQTQPNIAFIGAGNMASCLIGGLIKSGYDPCKIIASNPSCEKLAVLQAKFNILITTNNLEAVHQASIWILAVKPNKIEEVCNELSLIFSKAGAAVPTLIISVVTGIKIKQIQQWLKQKRGTMPLSIIRCMPNTPALIGVGATGLYADKSIPKDQKQFAERLMCSVGLIIWLDSEKKIDIVTALSGSGPAYFLYMFESLIKAAQKLGLDEENARILTLQTALGAARMASETTDPIITLRRHVTSPGGTTERAISVLQHKDFDQIIEDALSAAKCRVEEISTIFSKH